MSRIDDSISKVGQRAINCQHFAAAEGMKAEPVVKRYLTTASVGVARIEPEVVCP
jgi:hypothetical protein